MRERLKIYQRETQPLVDYYSTRPTFRSIDGNQPPDAVTAQLHAAFGFLLVAGLAIAALR